MPASQPVAQLAQQRLVQQILFAVIGLGSQQSFDIQQLDGHALNTQLAYLTLQAGEGFPIRGEQKVDQQVIGHPKVLNFAIGRRLKPGGVQLG